MDAKKKKPRQRNRPRNKANRMQQEPEGEAKPESKLESEQQEIKEVVIGFKENENENVPSKEVEKLGKYEESSVREKHQQNQQQQENEKANIQLEKVENLEKQQEKSVKEKQKQQQQKLSQTQQQQPPQTQPTKQQKRQQYVIAIQPEKCEAQKALAPPTNESQNAASAPACSLDNTSLKLLQQMMRSKLLKQEQNNGTKIDANHKTQSNEKANKTNYAQTVNSNKNKESCSSATGVKKHTPPPTQTITEQSVSSESNDNNLTEQTAFIASLQKKLEKSVANGSTDLPNTLLENLQKLINEDPLSDVESSDEEEEYVEYVYKPRPYFLVALCNFCKSNLTAATTTPCSRCNLVYYCSAKHAHSDEQHQQICYALQQVADNCDGHIFRKCGDFTTEQFRSYRIVIIRQIESIINRPMTATEQEVILFPRICCNTTCREYDFKKLNDCEHCGQVAYCRDKPEHLNNKSHQQWCQFYQLFKTLEITQTKFGRIEPTMPTKILRDIPAACYDTKQILNKLDCAECDVCEFAVLSQISTCPLTAWYALKLCGHLKKSEEITVHLIGAEIDFEVDALHKWELFFLHLNPNTKKLNVIFVGPELNQGNVPFAQLIKTKCCRSCRKLQRTVSYHFQNQLYHDYHKMPMFLKPDLICFFNAGLYRYNGFQMEDTWPETIQIATSMNCPIVVTSYTEYEAPLDVSRLIEESSRRLNMVMPPNLNPFASKKPERNFISDEDAPLMFKNYYCFVVE